MEFDHREILLLQAAVQTWMRVAQETLAKAHDEEAVAEITNDLMAMEILRSRLVADGLGR